MNVEGPPDWHADAACRGLPTVWWYPERGEGSQRAVEAICAACPVRGECVEQAMATHEGHGRWGGLSPKQRTRLRSRGEVEVEGGWVLYDAASGEVVFVVEPPSWTAREAVDAFLTWLAQPVGATA